MRVVRGPQPLVRSAYSEAALMSSLIYFQYSNLHTLFELPLGKLPFIQHHLEPFIHSKLQN